VVVRCQSNLHHAARRNGQAERNTGVVQIALAPYNHVMAGTSLLALIDDIASLLDDVAAMTKIATKKTAGVLGDDLALNAEQVSGVHADRELPVVWAVAKGSLVNKAILVPSALAISAIAPWAIQPLLMLGGAFLCFEGFEKVVHKFFHKKEEQLAEHAALLKAVADPAVDLVALEKDKIKGAVRTDFVLSAEIVVISLGAVGDVDFARRAGVLVAISLVMTIGVYGLVAGIVKLDDAGLWLRARTGSGAAAAQRALGSAILAFAPRLMKLLGVLGTIAMFLVGGGILAHAIPGLEGFVHHALEGFGTLAESAGSAATSGLIGVAAGALVLGAVTLVKKLRAR
jgi:predicted DNA repair protein MutK